MIPAVSVLMTAYNREKYIAEAIESVLASTFQDFELIIVDDCSGDKTVEIARRYSADPRVQVHVNAKNLGDYPNRNWAASYARGKYLKYVDSDDVLYPYGLEIMVHAMEQFPEAGFALSRSGSSALGDAYKLYPPYEAYHDHFFGKGLFAVGPGASIIRTSAFQTVNGFTAMHVAGDTDMWLRLGARFPMVSVRPGLLWWRQHEGQEIKKGLRSFAYDLMDYQIHIAALADPACPFSPAERERAIDRQKFFQARRIWRLALKKRHPLEAFRIYCRSQLGLKDIMRSLDRAGYEVQD